MHSARNEKISPTLATDAQLMKLVQARQHCALEELYKRYVRRGIRHAQNTGVDFQTAEDIVVDAFVKIWNHSEKFEVVRGTFSAWFHTMVHNLAIDELRRVQARSNAQMKSVMGTLDVMPDDDNFFAQEIDRIQVRTALESLPEAQQVLLRLAYVEGLSRREIAKRLALPLGTVHTRVRLGKEKLKRLLQEPRLPQQPQPSVGFLEPWATAAQG